MATGSVRVLLASALFAALAGCASQETTDHETPLLADLHGLALDPQDPAVVYVATHHGLFRARGDTDWAAVTVEPFDMMGFTVHPSNASRMWASGHPRTGGYLGFAESTDGGATWRVVSLAGQVDFHALAASRADPDRFWGWNGTKVWRSDDGGRTWDSWAPHGMNIAIGFASAASRDLVYAATDGGVYASPDGGRNWAALRAGSPATAVATSSAEPQLVVAFFTDGGLLRSDDGGLSWTSMNFLGVGADAAAAVAVHPTDSRTVYVGTFLAAIHKTTDAGATWSVVREAAL